MQRLFSTFANGLPGLGLLLQRLIAGGVVVQSSFVHLAEPGRITLLLHAAGIGAGLLLMIGLWTPIAAVVVALAGFTTFLLNSGDPVNMVLLATLGVTLALIGPGAWSIDARIFGRKQISVPNR